MAKKFSKRTAGLFPNGVFTRGSRDPNVFRINTNQSPEIKNALKGMTNRVREPRGKRRGATKAMKSSKEWAINLIRLAEGISSHVLSFTAVTALRAQKVFQDSFKYKRFYSSGEPSWKPLSDFTIKKRLLQGTWPGAGGILRERGDMYNSLKVKKVNNGLYHGYGVYTDPKEYKNGPHRGFVYAGLHNNPSASDTYGDGFNGAIRPRKAIKRQFMGHSTYIDQFIFSNIDRYMFIQALP